MNAKTPPALLVLAALAPTLTWLQHGDAPPTGYTDTPELPGSEWRVHDDARPRPDVVRPGTLRTAPSDATVLFDGSGLGAWQREGGGADARWAVADGAMTVNGTGTIETREHFGDVQLHLEFATPAEVVSSSQGRGNSGVFFLGRYEVQILDSYDNVSYADGQAAAMYGQYPPLVNASRPPGEWQTYDIVFRAPRFDGDELAEPAVVTVFHNGIVVHHAREFIGATGHRAVATYAPHPPEGPIRLQDHGNPVRFRNVWVRRLEL